LAPPQPKLLEVEHPAADAPASGSLHAAAEPVVTFQVGTILTIKIAEVVTHAADADGSTATGNGVTFEFPDFPSVTQTNTLDGVALFKDFSVSYDGFKIVNQSLTFSGFFGSASNKSLEFTTLTASIPLFSYRVNGSTGSPEVSSGSSMSFSVDSASLFSSGSLLSSNITQAAVGTPALAGSFNLTTGEARLGVNAKLEISPGANSLGVYNISGALLVNGTGLAVTASATLAQGPAAANDFSFGNGTTFSFEANSSSAAVNTTINGVNLNLPGGSFAKFKAAGSLSVLNQSLAGSFEFSKASGVTTVSATISSLDLRAGTSRILELSGTGVFQLASTGVAGQITATILNGPSNANIQISGSATLQVNTQGTAVDLGGGIVLASGNYIRVTLNTPVLSIYSSQFSATSMVFEKSGSVVNVSGTGMSLTLQAGTKRIAQVTGASGQFIFSDAGIAGALRASTLVGPDIANITLSATDIEVDVNTTSTATTVVVAGSNVTLAAAPAGGSYVRVALANGTLVVFGNSFTAQKFEFEKKF
jgi:hypothetical protein